MLLAAACDQGTELEESAVGPALRALATYPRAGAGTDCVPDDPKDCGVPVDLAFEVRFDRFLLPPTIGRANVDIYTGDHRLAVGVNHQYDVVERVVTYRPGGPLIPGALYTFELKLLDENGNGLRAFDGAPLEPGPVPLKFNFFTQRAPSAREAAIAVRADPELPDCERMVELFADAGCSSASCHRGKTAELGLDLSTKAGIRKTALHRVARETDLGDGSGLTLENPRRFGMGMARVDPSRPEQSYLLYKLLVNPENFRFGEGDPCRSTHQAALPKGSCGDPSEEETARLRNWFVMGDPMPPLGEPPVNRESLGEIERWIADGASCN